MDCWVRKNKGMPRFNNRSLLPDRVPIFKGLLYQSEQENKKLKDCPAAIGHFAWGREKERPCFDIDSLRPFLSHHNKSSSATLVPYMANIGVGVGRAGRGALQFSFCSVHSPKGKRHWVWM